MDTEHCSDRIRDQTRLEIKGIQPQEIQLKGFIPKDNISKEYSLKDYRFACMAIRTSSILSFPSSPQ
jgi:hypothetical protein